MTVAPKLSVVMSVFNGEEYLAGAVNSVLGQTFTDFEFIIIDDGSTDGSKSILEDFASRDPRIRVIEQQNSGLTRALRKGCDLAHGEYIARMDADDFSVDTRFAKQIFVLDQRPDCVAVTSHVEHFHDDGTVKMVAGEIGPEELIQLYNGFTNRIGGHGQVMFRRSAYSEAGGYDPHFRYSQDYDLWCRLLHLGRFAVIGEVLYRWRVGYGSTTDKNKDLQLRCATEITCREHRRLTGREITHETAMALIDLWWARKPERTPIKQVRLASEAMNRAVKSYFRKNSDLANFEQEARLLIARTYKWRIPLTSKWNLARKALLLAHAVCWRLSAITR
ncbi:MAG: glycosyltransferase [Pseudomonadota bacterium]